MRLYEDARRTYFKVIKLVEQKNGRCEECAKHWATLADIYFEEERYQDALSCYQSTTKTFSDLSYQVDQMMLHIMRRKGSCCLELKNFDNVINNLSKVLRIMIQSHIDDVLGDVLMLRFELGLGMYWLGNQKHAFENWKEALDGDVSRSDGTYNVHLKLDCIQKYFELGKNQNSTSTIR